MKHWIWIGLVAAVAANAQTHTEKITRQFTFEKKGPANALMVFNVNGDVKVEGHEGDQVVVEVEKTVRGKTEARLAKGKQEIQLGVIDRADTLILYVQGVCSDFGKRKDWGQWPKNTNGWGYNWNGCDDGDCDKEYDYEMNFVIKVPSRCHVLASTINEGDVTIDRTTGRVQAENVNGSIKLAHIAGPTRASTINGDVDLDYDVNPAADCRYYSLNGDINAYFVKGLSAQVSFDSFNGDFFTNVDELENLPVTLEKKSSESGIKYKLSGSRFRVGKGGSTLLDFETFNGNAYLREKK